MGTLPKKAGVESEAVFHSQFISQPWKVLGLVVDGHATSGITLELHVQCAHTSKFINGSVRLWTSSEPVQYSGQRAELEPNQCHLGPNRTVFEPNQWFGLSSKPVHTGSEPDRSNTSRSERDTCVNTSLEIWYEY